MEKEIIFHSLSNQKIRIFWVFASLARFAETMHCSVKQTVFCEKALSWCERLKMLPNTA